MSMWTISLPLSVAVSKKKQFILNLNRYRNAHFQVLAKAKVEFERVVKPLLKNVPKLDKCYLEYVHYPGKGVLPDTNNVCSIVDKFFADTLVNCGILKDDSPNYREDTRFRYGGRDVQRPRVDVIIRSTEHPLAAAVQKEKQVMKLTSSIILSQADVQEALKDLVAKKFPKVTNTQELVFNLAGNGTYESRLEMDLTVLMGAQSTGTKEMESTPVTLPPLAPTHPATPSLALVPPPEKPKPVEAPQAAPSAAPTVSPVSGSPFAGVPLVATPAVSKPVEEAPFASSETPPEPPPPGARGPSIFANVGETPK